MTAHSFGEFVKGYMGVCDMPETHVLITVAEHEAFLQARIERDVFRKQFKAVEDTLKAVRDDRNWYKDRLRDALEERNELREELTRVNRVKDAAKAAVERGDAELQRLRRLREYAEAMAKDFWNLRWELGTHPGQVVDRMRKRPNTPKEHPSPVAMFPGFSALAQEPELPGLDFRAFEREMNRGTWGERGA